MDQELRVRLFVRELKTFYINLTIYASVCSFCLVLWLCMGGFFWPIWVTLGCSIAAVLQGVRLGQLPSIGEYLPFLGEGWEDKIVHGLMQSKKEDIKSSEEPIVKENSNKKKTESKKN
jgi:hypothetical protein